MMFSNSSKKQLARAISFQHTSEKLCDGIDEFIKLLKSRHGPRPLTDQGRVNLRLKLGQFIGHFESRRAFPDNDITDDERADLLCAYIDDIEKRESYLNITEDDIDLEEAMLPFSKLLE